MKNREFYHCSICGNLFGVLHNAGPIPVCCGKDMDILTANTVDASAEKHVPFITRDGVDVKVQVGSDVHPMEDAHYITWILVQQGNHTQRIALKPGQEPKAEFQVKSADEPIAVYEYCNLHGLWMAEA